MPEEIKMIQKQKRYEEKMLKMYERLIIKLSQYAYRRYNGKYQLEDIMQEARLGAVKAIRTFDPSKNVKLITHIHNSINFSLSHYFRADTGLIHIPIRVLTDQNKTKPELVNNEFLYDFSSDKKSSPITTDNKIEESMLCDQYLPILPEKQSNILRKIYYEGYTYDEVASMYNISRQAISSNATKSLKKIKEAFH
jgi:RNA polymerase sigma factor (sigma-70 family)